MRTKLRKRKHCVKILLTEKESHTLQHLMGYDVTIPVALKEAGIGDDLLDDIAVLMDTLHYKLINVEEE